MTSTTWILLFMLSLLWGSSFFFFKIALYTFSPFTVVFGRVTIAAIVLLLFIVFYKRSLLPPLPHWRSFVVMAVLNNFVPFSLIAWGETQIDSGLAAILNATTPIFTVVLAHVTNQERITPNRFLGVLSGFIGVIVLVGGAGLRAFNVSSLGQFAVLGAALSYSAAGIYGLRFKALSPLTTTTGTMLSTTALLLPLVLLEHPWTVHTSATAWAALLALGIGCTAIAYPLYFRILAAAGATNLMLVAFLLPVNALLLGVSVLHEPLKWTALVGMACIFMGLIAIDGRLLRLSR